MAVAPELSVKKRLMHVLILSAASVIGVILTRALLRDRCCGCLKKKEAMLHNWQPNCPFWTFEFWGRPRTRLAAARRQCRTTEVKQT